MVNPGAIATTGLVPGGRPTERWEVVLDGLSRSPGRPLHLDEGLPVRGRHQPPEPRDAQLLHALGALRADPDEAVELYTRQSCLAVTAVDLAVMGATLADGGVHPVDLRPRRRPPGLPGDPGRDDDRRPVRDVGRLAVRRRAARARAGSAAGW